uniref:Uncharacterized protein n=1 Tax=Tanacetum cinerariifolium TaxID=118510 RepID=A0A6L2JFP1_TANCI|nr:hypothetical protein [Tanacetum cinerariifolium]
MLDSHLVHIVQFSENQGENRGLVSNIGSSQQLEHDDEEESEDEEDIEHNEDDIDVDDQEGVENIVEE